MSIQYTKNELDKIKGALFGFFIGDIVAKSTLLKYSHEIERQGKTNFTTKEDETYFDVGELTDQAKVTHEIMLPILSAINECRRRELKPNRFSSSIVEEHVRSVLTSVYERKAYRGMCKFTKHTLRQVANRKVRTVAERNLNTFALTRAVPLAVLDYGQYEYWNRAQVRLTNYNRQSVEVFQSYHEVINAYIVLDDKTNIDESKIKFLTGTRCIRRVEEPNDNVYNAYNNAIMYNRASKAFGEGILMATNEGGHSTIISALTGSIEGARFGYKNITDEQKQHVPQDVQGTIQKYVDFISKGLTIF